jgi:hypothetical protein
MKAEFRQYQKQFLDGFAIFDLRRLIFSVYGEGDQAQFQAKERIIYR